MTPTELVTAARNKYNAVGDSLWSDSELYGLFYEACQELAVESELIQCKDTSITTVASTKAYDYPDHVISIKRVEYDGTKLYRIDDRDADQLNNYGSASGVTGTPRQYWIWNEQIYLEPTPDAAATLTVYGYKDHTAITAATTMQVPEVFHMDLVNYVAAEMAVKDENYQMAAQYQNKWEMSKQKVKRWVAKRRRGDTFAAVKDENAMPVSYIGAR
jgi:hypothetical protein